MRKIILTIFLCGFVGAVFAQDVKFGVTAGLNVSSINEKDHEGEKIGFKPGFQVGVLVDLGLTSNFSIIPELTFSQKGAKYSEKDEDYKATMTLNYLTLPINAAYKFDLGTDQQFMVFAGPYLGYGLSTSESAKVAGTKIDIGKDDMIKFGSKEDNLKPFDFGANLGIGYQYSSIFFKLQYNLGLANMSPYKDSSWKNSNVAVTAGYMF